VEWLAEETEALRENLAQPRFAHCKSHMSLPRLQPTPGRWEGSDWPLELWHGQIRRSFLTRLCLRLLCPTCTNDSVHLHLTFLGHSSYNETEFYFPALAIYVHSNITDFVWTCALRVFLNNLLEKVNLCHHSMKNKRPDNILFCLGVSLENIWCGNICACLQ
jgi:hypothetical protein